MHTLTKLLAMLEQDILAHVDFSQATLKTKIILKNFLFRLMETRSGGLEPLASALDLSMKRTNFI